MVSLGSGAEREVDDFTLTRYACYLIAQNGDPSKEQVAFAQTYFAVQTRKAELIEKRLLEVERVKARAKLQETCSYSAATLFRDIRDKSDKEFCVKLCWSLWRKKLYKSIIEKSTIFRHHKSYIKHTLVCHLAHVNGIVNQ